MNIKSLLIGSAAAAVAGASAAQAADAIVVPEPEPMEYVRVCDVYGAGFFYIPGTETCLKVGGLVRFEIGAHDPDEFDPRDTDHGWNTLARAEVTLDARSETEYGTLRGYIRLRADSTMRAPTMAPGVNEGEMLSNGLGDYHAFVQDAIIELGGLSMGLTDTLYDAGISGEFDRGGGARVHFLRYTFDAAQGVQLAVALEEADRDYDYTPNVVGKIGFSQGWGGANLWGAYDATAEEFAVKAIVTANLTETIFLEGIATYESGPSFYSVDPYNGVGVPVVLPAFAGIGAEWSAGGLIGARFTPKFKGSIGAQYFSDAGHLGDRGLGYEVDVLRAGVTLDYQIVQNFNAKLAVNYVNADGGPVDADGWTGFLRFDRTF
ncbi:porin [Chelativorans sp. SCAU2101]|uniref:Porin n=1 Tax=Chelativorans petroleitrophicus TaxID=2975484 RepID=A0A9X3B6V7_9HYPH|nr:porin [Chelativorans petroleitrophicus]MCT8990923.1 porin [Chelativorans petroleitrophicus]